MQAIQPSTQQTISLCGSTVQYWIYNNDQKETILMVHGFTGNHRGFARIVDNLSGYRLIVPDLPAFGESTPMTKFKPTSNGYGRFLAQFIEMLELEKPIIFGHSFGSIIGAHLAIARPELIDNRLILANPISGSTLVKPLSVNYAGTRLMQAHYWLGKNLPGQLGKRATHNKTINRISTKVLIKTQEKKLRKEIYQHHLDDVVRIKHPDVYYSIYNSIIHEGLMSLAPEITQRVLLITGAEDRGWPPDQQKELLRKLSHAVLKIIPKTGHLAHFETPEVIANYTEEFLKG